MKRYQTYSDKPDIIEVEVIEDNGYSISIATGVGPPLILKKECEKWIYHDSFESAKAHLFTAYAKKFEKVSKMLDSLSSDLTKLESTSIHDVLPF